MYKKLLLALFIIALPVHVIAEYTSKDVHEKPLVKTETEQSELKYRSTQFTQPEGVEIAALEQKPSFDGFERVTENDSLILFVHKESLAIKLQDKQTNYVWNSGLDHPEQYRLNKVWTHMAQSAITVEFTDRQGKLRTESILTNDSRPRVKIKQHGFSADVHLNQSKLKFQLHVELDGDSLVVTIPDKKIKEDKRTKLISKKVYPFLGAVNEDDVNGYMFVPDGSGALIRYEKGSKKANSPFTGSIYGRDTGIQKNVVVNNKVNPVEPIRMPVFGAVHGVNQNGFITVVEEGFPYGDILAYPSGVSTDFNWITSQFHYRYEYYQPTSKSMNGITVYQQEANPFDIKLRYLFLHGEEANYVGMAKKYQHYLVENDQLRKSKDEVAVRLEFLGGEVKKGLLWDSVVPMTEISRIPAFTNELKKHDVDQMFVIYKGWSKGGLTGTLPAKFPVEKKLGSKEDFLTTIKSLKNAQIPMYFYTDYTRAFEGASGFSGSKDVARKISAETISQPLNNLTVYNLSPWKSLEMAKEESDMFRKYGIAHLAMDTTGSTLFSDFSKTKTSKREDTMATYGEIFSHLQKNVGTIAMYGPNAYALKAADRYLDVPMYSSNYVFESDTVPFVQIVLKGYMPYYAPFSNFSADPQDEVLRLIEYGAYPSFLLTEEPAQALSKTPSKDVYTSEYTIWKDPIIEQYRRVKESLGQVEGATIIQREVPQTGIVEVTYSNGKRIVVNYTSSKYKKDGMEVESKGFAVMDRGDQQ